MEPPRTDLYYLNFQKSRNDALYSNLIDARAEYRDRIWLELDSLHKQLQPAFDAQNGIGQRNALKRQLSDRYREIQSQDQLNQFGALLPAVPVATINACSTLAGLLFVCHDCCPI